MLTLSTVCLFSATAAAQVSESKFELFVHGGSYPGEIALQAWGDRDFRVRDLDGYYIRISEGRAIPVSR